MSSIREIKRQLDAAAQTIEALDAEHAAGRLAADEHAHRRAEREREVGRLFLILRQAQRETPRPAVEAPATSEPAVPWWRTPGPLVFAAAVVLALGIAGGVAVYRWSGEPARPAAVAGAPLALPPGIGTETSDTAPAQAPMSPIEIQALRLAVTRDDAPIPSMLRLAHIDLDAGRLDEARALYDRVIGRDPKNAEAITHQGSVLYQEGKVDEALAKVEAALRLDPTYVHAHWDRVQYRFHGKRDFPGTIAAGEAFLKVLPDGPDADAVRKLMAEAKRR